MHGFQAQCRHVQYQHTVLLTIFQHLSRCGTKWRGMTTHYYLLYQNIVRLGKGATSQLIWLLAFILFSLSVENLMSMMVIDYYFKGSTSNNFFFFFSKKRKKMFWKCLETKECANYFVTFLQGYPLIFFLKYWNYWSIFPLNHFFSSK